MQDSPRCALCGQLIDSHSKAADWNVETWPAGLEAIAEVIGPELTLRLADRFGGVEHFYVPKSPTTGHPWAAVIGEPAWEQLCRAMGGQRINLPRGQFVQLKKRLILELAETEGLSHRAIALRTRSTEGYVRGVLRGISSTGDERQGKLF